MSLVEGIGIIPGALFLVLVAFFVRRSVIARQGGTIDLSMRLHTLISGRGWATGRGRFVGDELRWYRLFSLSFRPGRVLCRRDLSIACRRVPDERERMVLPENWTIVRCADARGVLEVAMPLSTVAGFLSWVESSPPGVLPPSRV